MKKIPDEVILEWASKQKHIQDRLNRIKKRLKKLTKQQVHFEMRFRLIKKLKENKL